MFKGEGGSVENIAAHFPQTTVLELLDRRKKRLGGQQRVAAAPDIEDVMVVEEELSGETEVRAEGLQDGKRGEQLDG